MTINQGPARTLLLLSLLLALLLPAACAPVEMEPAAQTAVTPPAPEHPALPVITSAAGSPETLPVPSATILIYDYPGAPGHTPTPEIYPWPTQPPGPTDPPEPTEEPTATEIPFPTMPPTPVVTAIPTIAPPFLPVPDGTTAQPFTVYWRDGDVIRSLSTAEGAESRVFLDPAAEFGLYLTPKEAYYWSWGAISPDGLSIALVLTEVQELLDYSLNLHPVAIYILNAATRDLRLLVEGGADPVWSPDGKRLAYRTGPDLWVADVDTGATTHVYAAEAVNDNTGFPSDYVWSPDSHYLALIKEIPFMSYDLVVVDALGAGPPNVLIPGLNYWVAFPQWSPISNQISYILPDANRLHRYNLWIMDADGSNRRQLTHDLDVLTARRSPDGKWLALYALAAYEPEPADWDLWLLDPSADHLNRLTYGKAKSLSNMDPRWSPDGNQLLFFRPSPGYMHEAWVLSLVDGSERKLFSPAAARDMGIIVGP